MSKPETIVELAPRLRRKEVSPVELTRACLDRIEKMNPALNAFITVTADSALAEAQAAAVEISRGEWRGPLHGIPIALKGSDRYGGHAHNCGQRALSGSRPNRRCGSCATVAAGRRGDSGKNNLHEFAYGGSSLVSSLARFTIHGTWRMSRAVRPADRQLLLLLGFAMRRSGPIRLARFASRRRCADALGSSRLMGGSPARRDSAFVVLGSCWSAGGDRWRCGDCSAGDCGIRCRCDIDSVMFPWLTMFPSPRGNKDASRWNSAGLFL